MNEKKQNTIETPAPQSPHLNRKRRMAMKSNRPTPKKNRSLAGQYKVKP